MTTPRNAAAPGGDAEGERAIHGTGGTSQDTEFVSGSLDFARALARSGIPIVLAKPALDAAGNWNPAGGTDRCGYWIPPGWQRTEADPAVLDRYQAGMAMLAVMGHGLDLIDCDPRHNGDNSLESMRRNGQVPTVYAEAATPSGGSHLFVASMGARSLDNVLPGIDIKAGDAEGKGRGLAFIAPTRKASKGRKDAGRVSGYTWTLPPDLDRLRAHAAHEDAADRLVELINKKRGGNGPGERTERFTLPDVIPAGERDNTLYRYACSMRARGLPVTEALQLMEEAHSRCEQPPGNPYPLDKALAKIDRAWANFEGPTAVEIVTDGGSDSDASITDHARSRARHVMLTPASDIPPRRAHWLWDGRIAVGTIGLLAGREGLGKSTVAYWIAAMITRGRLPGEYHGKPRAVLVCATEDSWAHTIVPRLIAASADLDRVYRIEVRTSEGLHGTLSLPADLTDTEEAINDTGAALVILDPLTSRLTDALDTHKDADVRRALEPLAALADRASAAVLGLMHHNKADSTDPLNLIMGSRAFTAVARSVHTVVPDPDDKETRLFGTVKNNLGRTDLPSLSFRLEEFKVPTDDGDASSPCIKWGPDVHESITDALRRSARQTRTTAPTATDDAADWLSDYLAAEGKANDQLGTGRWVESATVKKAAADEGHSARALRGARERLEVRTEATGFPRRTWWSLPVTSSHAPNPPSRGEMSQLN